MHHSKATDFFYKLTLEAQLRMLAKSLISKNTFIRTSLARCASNFVVLGDSSKFSEIIKSDSNKILYFTAAWCPPCKKIAPIFEKLSSDFVDTTFVKIDIDDHRDLAEEYNISSVPTFKAFIGSKLVSEFAGADEAALRRTVEGLQKKK